MDWDITFDEVSHSEPRPPVATSVGKALYFICFVVNIPRSLPGDVRRTAPDIQLKGGEFPQARRISF